MLNTTSSNGFQSLHNASLLIEDFHFTNTIQGSMHESMRAQKGTSEYTHGFNEYFHFVQSSTICIISEEDDLEKDMN